MKRLAELAAGRMLRDVLLLGWIGATSVFFFLRFSVIFYAANEAAFGRLLRSLWH